ncbi:MAG: hypothetical protein ACHQU1_03400, partial [Gemmatimonadales bacterium]
MFERARVALLGLALSAGSLKAQRPADADPRGAALLARAESLERFEQQLDSARKTESAQLRRGQIVRAGRLVAVFKQATSPEAAQRVVARADSILGAFGGKIAAWKDSIVGVQQGVSDSATVVRAPDLRRRRVVPLLGSTLASDSISEAQQGASWIAREYQNALDSTWQRWLPSGDAGVVWTARFEGERALAALTDPIVSTGSGCLAGRPSECRLWLGLDPTDRPTATRYRVTDLRADVARMNEYGSSPAPGRVACLAGDDVACVRFAESRRLEAAIPSPGIARTSVVRAVWALHGVETVDR